MLISIDEQIISRGLLVLNNPFAQKVQFDQFVKEMVTELTNAIKVSIELEHQLLFEDMDYD